MKKFLEKNSSTFYFVFRVLIGIGFLLHGIMKLPGILDGSTSILSLMGLAGIIEVVGGAFLIVGLFVRPVAVISAIEMLVAFFYMHVASNGTLNPLANRGEAAMLYFAAFLVLMGYGAGKWAIDKKSSK
jgi:putative oxidoreductase